MILSVNILKDHMWIKRGDSWQDPQVITHDLELNILKDHMWIKRGDSWQDPQVITHDLERKHPERSHVDQAW